MELPHTELPLEGSTGPHTYLASQTLVACEALDHAPTIVPWDPSPEEAMAACSTLPGCGGFLLTTTDASVASGGFALRYAQYCKPQSFTTGVASATSQIGFVRYVYTACDMKVKLTTKTTHFHGQLSSQRSTCIRLGHGVGAGVMKDRRPAPNVVKHRAQPRRMVAVAGVSYELNRDVFREQSVAAALSADGAAHVMQTASGVEYYMPGASHAEKGQPFALDGFYPLYETEASAQYASIRGGGNGLARSVGPTTAYAQPVKWTQPPQVQVYYLPQDGAKLFLGNYVAPFALDGYFPLYRNRSDAEAASDDGQAQSHGPGSDTRHPLWWSSGQYRAFYMPTTGHSKFYGNYTPPLPDAPPLYSPVLPTCTTSQAA